MAKIRQKIKIGETAGTIIAEEKFIALALDEIRYQRIILENYISKDPMFLHSLKPYYVSDGAPEIIRKMSEAAARSGLGPMASVAGAIAYFAVRAMVNHGARYAVFENGGDLAIFADEPVLVGLYSGEKIKGLAFRIDPRPSIIGLCSSSGKMGHSFSLGLADLVTVISEDPVLADATATAICNSIKVSDPAQIEEVIKNFMIPPIEGIFLVMDDQIGLGGKLPKIINLPFSEDLITIA